jgi:esterase/lipase superfamily enzyme
MTLEQFIADTLSVTDYLRERFSKEKIYLMAHSEGTFIGLQTVRAQSHAGRASENQDNSAGRRAVGIE